jgi:hypothetical protein
MVYNASLPKESRLVSACSDGQKTPFAVWRILFSKKAVIRQMDARQLSN